MFAAELWARPDTAVDTGNWEVDSHKALPSARRGQSMCLENSTLQVSLTSSLVRRKQAGLGMDEEGACGSNGFRAVQEGGSLERTAGSDGLGLRGKGPVKRKSKALVGDGFSVRNKEPRAAGESGGCQGCQETSS